MTTNARAIKNTDDTFRLIDMNGEPFKLTINFLHSHATVQCKQNLELWEMTDLKCYGVNIINLDEIC